MITPANGRAPLFAYQLSQLPRPQPVAHSSLRRVRTTFFEAKPKMSINSAPVSLISSTDENTSRNASPIFTAGGRPPFAEQTWTEKTGKEADLPEVEIFNVRVIMGRLRKISPTTHVLKCTTHSRTASHRSGTPSHTLKRIRRTSRYHRRTRGPLRRTNLPRRRGPEPIRRGPGHVRRAPEPCRSAK